MTENTDTERTAEEIADEHDHMIEFGRAVKQLRDAADTLERNGHVTVGAQETVEDALENINTVGREEMLAAQAMREYIKERQKQGATIEEAREEWYDGERIA